MLRVTPSGMSTPNHGAFDQTSKLTRRLYSSAVEAWSKASPGVPKWTKSTVAQHITVGGLGATPVGTPAQVADNMEQWVQEADVDGFNLVSIWKSGRNNIWKQRY